ncbi:MAG: serpin family protein [Oscillospiraceae bacterium]|nr:serpin family protein [Oscillospiraceae bacterium]
MSDKSEKIFDGITNVSDELIESAQKKPKRRGWRRLRTPLAAILVIAILCGIALTRRGLNAYAVAEAEYPKKAAFPRGEFYGEGDAFLTAVVPELLSGAGDENRVCSPINVYMGLSMLAELTDGGTRDQLLDLLGAPDLTAQRERANKVWNANYSTERGRSVLANSIWLNRDVSYSKATLNILAQNYFASSYSGEMGSRGYNEALRKWLNDQTGGLLRQQAGQLSMDPDTVMTLASTVFFKGTWSDEFKKGDTYPETFHGPGGDETCDFMHMERMQGQYYWAERFSAVVKHFTNGRAMWFILPDEGVSMEELVNDPELVSFLSSERYERFGSKDMYINLSVPKFDVGSDLDLREPLRALGVTDAFELGTADFSPLTQDTGVYVSRVQQAARVQIDEEGCTAAAYIAIVGAGAAAPPTEEIDFVLDRPFLFAITYLDQLPLFVGIVNDP